MANFLMLTLGNLEKSVTAQVLAAGGTPLL
jgi:hypothetical protein